VKLSLQTKLIGAFLIVLVMMIGLGIFMLTQLNQSNQNLTYLNINTVPSLQAISDMQNVMNEYRRVEYRHILATDAQNKQARETDLETNKVKLDQLFKDYEAVISDTKDGQYLADVKAAWNAYLKTTPALLELSRNKDLEATRQMMEDTRADFLTAFTLSADWTTYNMQLGDNFAAASQAAARQALQLGIGLMVAASLIGLGLGFFLARSMAKAAKLMAHTAEQIAQVDLAALEANTLAIANGDLTQTVSVQTQPLTYTSGDEMGDLARAFNAMIARLQGVGVNFAQMTVNLSQLVGQVADNANNLGSASVQLSGSAEQASSAASQVAATIQQVATGTAQQVQAVTKSANIVEQVSRAIDGVASGAQEQAAAVSRSAGITTEISSAVRQVAINAQAGADGAASAAKAARNGTQTVEQTIQGMHAIKAKVGLSAQKVQEMGQRSHQIGAIVETIDDIASQTNLLALNAAIEAARAGEHGKGFAVVADEVRKLAEKSATATKEIGGLIRGIQQTVTEAVQAMDEGAKEVEVGVLRANEAGAALADILSAAETVTRQAEAIAAAAQQMSASSEEMVSAMETVSAIVEENTAATEEMAASSGEITLAIESIASVSEENSAATEEVSAATEEMNAQIEEVTASAQALSQMAQTLQAVVGQFTLLNSTGRATQGSDREANWSLPRPPATKKVTNGYSRLR